MTKKEADIMVADLGEQKTELEKNIAVLSSDLQRQEAKLEESSAKVEEIVGSTDKESVKEYLVKLDNDIKIDIEKLKEME